MINEKRLFDILKQNRATVLQYNLKFPEITEADSKINDFIYSFTKKYEDYIKTSLFNYAATKYESDPNPRKHLHFKPLEVFQEYRVTYNDGNVICIVFDVILRQDGRIIGFDRFSHTFDMKSGLIIPLKYLASNKKSKKHLKKAKLKNFFLENRMVVGYENKFYEAGNTVKIRKSDLGKFIHKTDEIPFK